MRPRYFAVLTVLGLLTLESPVPMLAQSLTSGSVTGAIVSETDQVVSRASVRLESLEIGLTRSLRAGTDGQFAARFVASGTYRMHVEALGYVPVTLGPFEVTSGTTRHLRVTLRPASGIVVTVDTVAPSAAGRARNRPGGTLLWPDEIGGLPTADGALGKAVSLSTTADANLGTGGLPGSMTSLWIDGVPFFPALHPRGRTPSDFSAAFPLLAMGSLAVLPNAGDIEWSGGGGGYVQVESAARPTLAAGAISVAGSAAPLWSSSELTGATPSLTSFWGSSGTSVTLVPDTSTLFLFGEGLRRQLPTARRIRAEALESLSALDPVLVQELIEPGVEQVTRVSALARLDWWLSPERRFTLRGSGGRMVREYDGAGPPILEYGTPRPLESADFSVAGELTSEYTDEFTVELRAGVSGSQRGYSDDLGRATAYLADSGLQLGDVGEGLGEVSRLDVFISPTGHYRTAGGVVKGGVQLRAARYSVSPESSPQGEYRFGSAEALVAGRGTYEALLQPSQNFATSDVSAFAQYSWEAAPGLELTLGLRADQETLPGGTRFNPEWLAASGIKNDSFPNSFRQFGARASMVWDILADGSTILSATGSIHQGDIANGDIHQLLVNDGAASIARSSGTGLQWPQAGEPQSASSLPVLSLFGPDMQAPRVARVSVGFRAEIARGWSLWSNLAAHRADYLVRRRNLNLSVLPVAVDQNGRPILGDLIKTDALVTTAAGTNRRFPDFDDVWALDPDGWSEHRSATFGIEYGSDDVNLSGSYTRSRTEDNWFGAARGNPSAELIPKLPDDVRGWDIGTSDFDVPHRLTGIARLGFGQLEIQAYYRLSSARPFTPGFRAGVDVNGDGSGFNDVAYVPSDEELGGLNTAWACLESQRGAFAARNSCRGELQHALDARLVVRVAALSGRNVDFILDAIGLIEPTDGWRDEALLVLDPDADLVRSADGGTIALPYRVNPSFGEVLMSSSRGRFVRLGVRIGSGR